MRRAAGAMCVAATMVLGSCRRAPTDPASAEPRVAPAPLPVAASTPRVTTAQAATDPSPRESPAPSRPFSVRTPADWTEVPPATPRDAWTFHNADGSEQLTVSDVPHVPLPDARTEIAACDQIIEAHRQAERRVSSSSLQLGEVLHGEIGGQRGARWSGFESEMEHRAWTLVVCTATRFEVFYYEALNATAGEADSRARALFNSVSVH